uniref:Major facilitator superfamily (MFS) profile domain-containing protein n=1 Tax=Mycena chlorophos TaxID=658473 RepID=A0ABQ0LCY6_MYCCL|nr:predicted protein [Mycena chlorophos]
MSSPSIDAPSEMRRRPWWRRPAAWWLMLLAPMQTIVQSGTASAQVEVFSDMVCKDIYGPNAPVGSPGLSSSTAPNLAMTPGMPVVPCSADPTVQAAVAQLEIVILMLTGILTFATATWWGSFSDRHGRATMIGICSFGGLLAPVLLVVVTKYTDYLPGGYRFIVLNAVVVGLLGGAASEGAAVNAYLADICKPEERSRSFSVILGFTLAGLGVGPLLGSLILRSTHDVILLFYLAGAVKAVQVLIAFFILPESLSPEKMQRAVELAAISSSADTQSSILQRIIHPVMFVLRPLSVLLPEKDADGKRGDDWNLLLLVVSEGLMLLAASSLINQFLYALRMFQWDAEYLGYCISSIGFARATYLVLILPPVLKYGKARLAARSKSAAASASPESQPLLSSSSPTTPSAYATIFDLGLARFSILFLMVSYALMPLAPTGQLFILFISLSSVGAGLDPTANSIALELYTRRVKRKAAVRGTGKANVEAGKLFGAVGVVQAIFGRILGPPIYGSIYSATVEKHPRTLFIVAFANSLLAFGMMSRRWRSRT